MQHPFQPQKQSLIIAAIVAVSMLVMAGFVQVVLGTVGVGLGLTDSIFELYALSLVGIGIVWARVLAGAFVRWTDVRAGGAVIARSFGAVHASDRSRYQSEKMLLQAVAQMAIASHCARPEVFVLREEHSINSFSVGSLSGDTAIVVTAGALAELPQDELEAIVAHEFAHIALGDVATHMKLLVAFSGLLFLDRRGRELQQRVSSKSLKPVLKIAGGLLRAIGFIGVLTKALLGAIFLHQSEYAADEKTVEFLRRGKPLQDLLNRIQSSSACDIALSLQDVDELRHLCIHAGNASSMIRKMDVSHPQLSMRVQAIDHVVQPVFSHLNENASHGASVAKTPAGVQSKFNNLAGEKTGTDLDAVDVALKGCNLSAHAASMMQDSITSMAALFALFLPERGHARDDYLSSVAFAFNQFFAKAIEKSASEMPMELREQRVSVIQYASHQLRETLDREAALKVVLSLERLLKAQGLYDLMSCAALQDIRHKLNADFPVLTETANKTSPNATQKLVKSADQMSEQFALLLSLVLESANVGATAIDVEYQRLLKCYTELNLPRRTGKESGVVDDTEAAFQALLVQPSAVREAFVEQCMEIAAHDDYVSPDLVSKFQVFFDALQCQPCEQASPTVRSGSASAA